MLGHESTREEHGVHCECMRNSVCKWFQFLREKCSERLLKTPNYIFGGPASSFR